MPASKTSDLATTCWLNARAAHTQLLTRSMLDLYGLQPHEHIMELGSRMCCRQCDARGRVSIYIKWAK